MRTSLTVKIWLAFSLVSLSIFLVVMIMTPLLIREYFTDALMEPATPPQRNVMETTFSRGFHIRSFILLEDGTTIPSNARNAFPPTLLNEMKQNIIAQKSNRQMYESVTGQGNIRY
ncbi:sensor histidine kinase, partial [Desulforamulus aquiferis]|nr:sensor histidine kinase [Desulforamulus aquiferis]